MKFMRRGNTQARWLPTIASATKAPTVAEWTAGTDLGVNINNLEGLTFTNQPIDIPDLATQFTKKIAGEDQAEDTTLTIYLDSVANPLRTTLAKGTAGFLTLRDFGAGAPIAGDKVDVWPTTITGIPKQYDLGNAAALWQSQCVHHDTPALDIAVLA